MKTVTAAIIEKDGRILIAKRRAEDTLANKWEFPGGTVEEGETPEECLVREMKEEFDIGVSIGKCLGESIYHYDHGTIQLIAYHVFWNDNQLIPKAHDEIQWVSMQQITNYDFSPADVPFVEKLRRGEIEF